MLETGLYLISSPIGNLKDITLRALEVLEKVDVLYAEDTRVTKKLLSHYQINRELYPYYEYNEEEVLNELLKHLEKGLSVGYISDAGTPGVSDPGYGLIKNVKGLYRVISIPGPSAVLAALVSSGLPIQPFTFIGFLDRKKAAREKTLKQYQDLTHTLVFYERKDRLVSLIKELYQLYGNRKITIARELTKKFETIYHYELKDEIEIELKGEFVLIVEGAKAEQITETEIVQTLKKYLNKGYLKKTAILKVSEELQVNKNEVYQIAIRKVKK